MARAHKVETTTHAVETTSKGSANQSNNDVNEVEEIVSSFGPRSSNGNATVSVGSTGGANSALTTGQGSGSGGAGTNHEEFSEAPSRVQINPRGLQMSAEPSNSEIVMAESAASLQQLTVSGESMEEGTTQITAQSGPLRTQASQAPAIAEAEPRATGPKKPRRKGSRLTRVKNERSKKTKANEKAKAAAAHDKGIEPPNVAGPSTVHPAVREEEPMDVDRPLKRVMRAAVRAAQRIEAERTAGAAMRKNKGKGKAKDVSNTPTAVAGSKRKRRDDYDAEDQVLADPGPSRPTRRTRRKAGPSVQEEEVAQASPSLNRDDTQGPSTHTKLSEDSAPARGTKRCRSLAPEPSEQLIEEVRKRARVEACSWRVTPERSAPLEDDEDDEKPLVKLEGPESKAPSDTPANAGTNADGVAEARGETMGADSDEPVAVVNSDREAATREEGSATAVNEGEHETESQPAQATDQLSFLEDIIPSWTTQFHATAQDPLDAYIDTSELPNDSQSTYGPSASLPPIPVGPNHRQLRRHETIIYGTTVHRPENKNYWRR